MCVEGTETGGRKDGASTWTTSVSRGATERTLDGDTRSQWWSVSSGDWRARQEAEEVCPHSRGVRPVPSPRVRRSRRPGRPCVSSGPAVVGTHLWSTYCPRSCEETRNRRNDTGHDD